MALHDWWEAADTYAGSPFVRRLRTELHGWCEVARDVAAAAGQLLALWSTPGTTPDNRTIVRAAYLLDFGTLVVELPLVENAGRCPDIQSVFPAAGRLQRAAFDLCGTIFDHTDQRPWLRHAAWPADFFPLQSGIAPSLPIPAPTDRYPFVRVQGEGVHEIAVGPVHAGTIEPGHFRFSIVGEKVLRLEERLGYVHKGIEHRFTELPILEAHRLAARVSGDSAVAFSWAYCQALEGINHVQPPRRGLWLRALCLEIERIQNHLGDLGAIGNDAGFAFGLAQFSRLKEELLRTVNATMGQRYLFDAVCPGGTAFDLLPEQATELSGRLVRIEATSAELRQIYDNHSGLRDRFTGAGKVLPELAQRLGLVGLAARASGLRRDLRLSQPCQPYDELQPEICVQPDGDVAARVAIRFAELRESCHLGLRILAGLPTGAARNAVPWPAPGRLGIGIVEGWRGPVMVALEPGPNGTIRRCYPHDPSRQNWPVLEHAIIGNIVPDFPLINKSFNLSYSGHDL